MNESCGFLLCSDISSSPGIVGNFMTLNFLFLKKHFFQCSICIGSRLMASVSELFLANWDVSNSLGLFQWEAMPTI